MDATGCSLFLHWHHLTSMFLLPRMAVYRVFVLLASDEMDRSVSGLCGRTTVYV